MWIYMDMLASFSCAECVSASMPTNTKDIGPMQLEMLGENPDGAVFYRLSNWSQINQNSICRNTRIYGQVNHSSREDKNYTCANHKAILLSYLFSQFVITVHQWCFIPSFLCTLLSNCSFKLHISWLKAAGKVSHIVTLQSFPQHATQHKQCP